MGWSDKLRYAGAKVQEVYLWTGSIFVCDWLLLLFVTICTQPNTTISDDKDVMIIF